MVKADPVVFFRGNWKMTCHLRPRKAYFLWFPGHQPCTACEAQARKPMEIAGSGAQTSASNIALITDVHICWRISILGPMDRGQGSARSVASVHGDPVQLPGPWSRHFTVLMEPLHHPGAVQVLHSSCPTHDRGTSDFKLFKPAVQFFCPTFFLPLPTFNLNARP